MSEPSTSRRMNEETALWVIARLVEEYADQRPLEYEPDLVVQMVADYISELEHTIDEANRRITDLETWLTERTEKLRALQSLKGNSVNCNGHSWCSLLNDEHNADLFENTK